MTVKASNNLYSFIKQQEGFSSTPYKDFTGKKTIGYGTSDQIPKSNMSASEAERIMRDRVSKAEQDLSAVITRNDLTPSQQDALLDMHYNLGFEGMKKDGFIDLVNGGDNERIAQAMLRYNKATNPRTGELEILPGLARRVEQRALWWNSTDSAPYAPSENLNSENESDLVESMREFDQMQAGEIAQDAIVESVSKPPQELDDETTVRLMEQFDAVGVVSPENIDGRIRQMRDAQGLFTPEQTQRTETTIRLSREFNVDPLLIDAELETMTEEQVRAKYQIPEIARRFPTLSKWAARPENYVILENNPDWTQGLVAKTEQLSPEKMSETEKAVRVSLLNYPKSYILTLLASGGTTPEKAQNAIRRIEAEQARFRPDEATRNELENLANAGKNLTPEIKDFIDQLSNTWSAATSDNVNKAILPELKKLYKETDEGFDQAWEYIKTMYENPSGAASIIAQAGVSTLGPLGAGLVGAASPIPLAGPGAAFAVGAVLGIGESMQQDLEQFRNQNGEIDLVSAFSDPKRAEMFRKRALTYGPILGAADAIYGKIIGKGFIKVFKEGTATTVAGKVGQAAAGVAAETGIGAAEEGASQFTASVARAAVDEEGVTSQEVAEAGTEAFEESVYGGVIGGTIGTATGILKTGTRKFLKMKEDINEVTKASSDGVDLHETKTILKQNDVVDTNPEAIKELVNEVTLPSLPEEGGPPPIPAQANLPAIPTDAEISIYDDADAIAESEAVVNTQEEMQGFVTVSPSELIEFFEGKGLNPYQAMQSLSAETYQQFTANIDTDTSVNIPVSEWVTAFREDGIEDIDEIVRVGDNELNMREAAENFEEIQKDPFLLYQLIEEGDESLEGLPPIPQEADVAEDPELSPPPIPEQQTGVEQAEDSEIIRLSDIKSRFRSDEEQSAFERLKRKLRRSFKTSDMPNAVADGFAEILFQHHKTRSDVLDIPVEQLVDNQNLRSAYSSKAMGWFNPSTKEVTFAQSADPATVVHEFGHAWLDELANDYTFLANTPFEEMTPAQKDYFYSMKTAANLLGLDNIGQLDSLSRPERTKAHETFAQTAEAYFLEGKFQGVKVASVMEQFRKYMVGIIDAIKAYASFSQFPTLEITGEVERMFEGIIGVDRAIDEELIPKFRDPLFDPSLLGEQAAQYYDTTREALNEAVGRFATRIIKASYKEREKLIDGALNAAFEEAAQVVDSQAEFVLAAQFQDQYIEHRRRTKEGKPSSEPRISYSSFLELFNGDETAADIAKGSIPNFVVAPKKKGGVPISQVMHNLGINNPEDMVNTLMLMGTRDQQVSQTANKLIEENFPVLKTDLEIRNEAVEQLSNDRTSKLLNEEMKILAQNFLPTLRGLAERFITPPEVMRSPEFIKTQALQQIGNTRLAAFKMGTFKKDYGRHGKKAAKAFRQGDFAAAFDAKVRSAISYEAFGQAIGVRNKIIAANHRMKQFVKYSESRDHLKRYNVELMEYGKRLIEAVSKNATIPVLDIDSFPSYSGVTQDVVDGINGMVRQMNNNARGVFGDSISVRTYLDFAQTIRLIQKTARAVKEVETLNNKYVLGEIKGSIVSDIEGSKSRTISYEREGIGRLKVEKDFTQTVLFSLYDSDIDVANSGLGELLSDIESGQADRNLNVAQDFNRIRAAFTKIAKASKGTKFQEIAAPILSRVPFAGSLWNYDKNSQPIISPENELNYTFNNMGELITAILLMGSDSGAQRLINSNGLNIPYNPETNSYDMTNWDNFIRRLVEDGTLKKEHFDAIQDIWDLLREKQPQLKKAFRETDGYNVGNIEGRTMKTPFGAYRGGYFPIAQARNIKQIVERDSLLDVDHANLPASKLFPIQNTGMVNRRRESGEPIDLDPNKMMIYIGAVNDIIHLRKPMKNFGKVFSDPEVQAALDEKRPGALDNVIIPWFQRVKNQQRTEPGADALNVFARKLRANINRTIYLFNFLTPFKQLFGKIPAVASVDAGRLARSMAYTTANPRDSFREVNEKSKVMRERFEATFSRHIRDWEDLKVNFDWVSQADEVIDRVTFVGIQFMQNKVDTSIWLAAYEQAGDAGLSEKRRIFFADSAVQATQAASTVTYLNNLQTRSSVVKLLTGIATSYVFSVNNVVTKEGMRQESTQRQARAIIGWGLLLYFVNNLLDQGLETLVAGLTAEGPEEEEKVQERMESIGQRAAVGTLSQLIPIVGNIPNGFMYSGNADLAPAITKIERALTGAGSGVRRTSQGIDLTPYEIRGILDTITIFSGIPTSALAEDIFIEDVWMEGLQGETLDDRLRRRRFELRLLRARESMEQ